MNLPRPPPLELWDGMVEAASPPSVAYYVMLTLSSCLAITGLIADSSAVIIGALIIAPMMNPIIARDRLPLHAEAHLMTHDS